MKPKSLSSALAPLDRTAEHHKKPKENPPVEKERVGKMPVPPSRRGKKALTGYFSPAVSRQLKQMALDLDRPMQALLGEAMNELFSKHGKPTIA